MGDLINATETNQTTLVYGDRWRIHRKLMHSAVGSQAVRNLRSIQANESKLLIRDILQDPEDYVLSIERYSVSTTSIIGWGRRIDTKNDYVAQQALAIMEGVNFVIPGKFLMEAVPALTKLPSWVYALPSMIRDTTTVLQQYFYMLSQEGAESKWNNFSKVLLNGQETYGLSDVEVAGLTANLIGGRVDTTSSTMISCILAMAVFPDVQRKAQAEIDSVVGDNTSPTWEDVDGKLPYCTALVKEVLRWRTVTVLAGIPHANTVDFEYRGYRFPAGTNILGNIWAIHRHPREFPEPDNFRPERFLNGLEQAYPNNKGMNPFGWGRRQCSGQPLAEQGLLYSLTRLIWAFNIKPSLDEHGNEVKLDIFAYTDCENMRPEPFRARFTPRSDKIKHAIMEEAKIAREELRVYDGETKLTLEDAVQALASEKKGSKK
ncbi:cytochrome P450 [Mollisia scopiformis]|uniref:Cytochrome P450 n=1 Tax=Mollisia scopiformis TaxID=149040 RepID=A0A194XUX4_MOLSC|nr:cytochrome P450 [Mollisia scopiformis]KUJ23936.1 cytochrome P450 [Mollisia scopiformis]